MKTDKRKKPRREKDVAWKRPRSEDLHTGERVYHERRTGDRRKDRGR